MAATATKEYRNLIGGSWEPGSAGGYEVINPATEAVVGTAPEASAADAEAAASAARGALAGWRRTSPRPAPISSARWRRRSASATTTCCR